MSVEQAPLTAVQKKTSSANTKISSLGTLKSKLADLQTAANTIKPEIGKTALEKFATYSASSADSTVATAKVGSGAIAGNYTLVVSQLAQAQRLVSGTYALTSTPVGTNGQTLTFDFGTPAVVGGARSKTITLDGSNNSLAGLRNSINAANMGAKATIVNGTNGAQLVLTAEEGLDNKITLGGTITPMPLTQTVAAQNAEFTLNGIASTSSSNTASKVLDGVTLNLLKGSTSTPGTTTLTIASEYSEKMTANLNSFITAYNAANSTMKTMGAYNPTTKVAGALQGNSILREAQTQTRNLLFNTTAGGTSSFQRLSDIGVTVGTDGALSLSSSKLSSALAADPSAVASLLGKVGTEFNKTIEKFVSSSGTIKISTDSINSVVKELSNRSDAIERRLVTIEARFRKQFSSLDTLISGLNSTSDYLTQQLANLSG
jgi:flagellar hook-associated protein 2